MTNPLNRREILLAAGAVSLTPSQLESATQRKTPGNLVRRKPAIRYCLNTSTIRGQKLPIDKIVALAAKAGYDGIEPWINEIKQYRESGGKLSDLKKQISDAGLIVESAIGFANWIVDDDRKRKQALDVAKRDMEIVKAIGGERIAAPPAGTRESVNLDNAAQRYRALLEVGESIGVVPQLELWGFSKPINRLGELLYIAAEAGHKNACVLPDVYHIYKGGSDFAGLSMLEGKSIHVFHVNDYPAEPKRDKINDADRVYPGDGIAPMSQILNTLFKNGFAGALSLELFNRTYWKQDAAKVAAIGLKKMKACVAKATAQKK